MADKQIPLGTANLVCPLHKRPMIKVCHTCPWWVQVRGRNPNTGEDIDRWDCSIALLPILSIEVAHQARSGAAATESFRNELVHRIANSRAEPPRQITSAVNGPLAITQD
jgi:hypothetical protein